MDAFERKAPGLAGYAALRRLGGGASAQVWLVQSESGGEPVAAKCFPPQCFAPQEESQITREWRLLTNYDHDHVLAVHGAAELADGGRALLVEYAPGGSLRQVVAVRGRLGVGETVTVLTPLAQALAYLHANAVVHGDVSPGNVLFSVDGKPLLADLGLGRLAGERPVRVAGTEGFAAPDERLAAAADVYSAAAVGWFALTGSAPPPTAGRPPLRALVPEVPAELVAALEAGLHEVAAQRPTAAELAQAVYRSAPAEPVDLALAVHSSVLPDLPTGRHARPARPPGRLRSRLPRLGRPWLKRPRLELPQLELAHGDRPGWRRPRGRLLAGLATAVLVLALGAGALAAVSGWRPGSGPGPAAAASEPVEGMPDAVRAQLDSQDPAAALAGLAWLRGYALEANRADLLADVNAEGSQALAADLRILAQLTAARHSLRDVHQDVSGINRDGAVPGLPAGAVALEATAVTAPYAELDAQGVVVRLAAKPVAQHLRFVLLRTGTAGPGTQWRIWQVQLGAGS